MIIILAAKIVIFFEIQVLKNAKKIVFVLFRQFLGNNVQPKTNVLSQIGILRLRRHRRQTKNVVIGNGENRQKKKDTRSLFPCPYNTHTYLPNNFRRVEACGLSVTTILLSAIDCVEPSQRSVASGSASSYVERSTSIVWLSVS